MIYVVVAVLAAAGYVAYHVFSNRHVCPKCRAREQVDTCWCCGEPMVKGS